MFLRLFFHKGGAFLYKVSQKKWDLLLLLQVVNPTFFGHLVDTFTLEVIRKWTHCFPHFLLQILVKLVTQVTVLKSACHEDS